MIDCRRLSAIRRLCYPVLTVRSSIRPLTRVTRLGLNRLVPRITQSLAVVATCLCSVVRLMLLLVFYLLTGRLTPSCLTMVVPSFPRLYRLVQVCLGTNRVVRLLTIRRCTLWATLVMLLDRTTLSCREKTVPCRLPTMLLNPSSRPWTLKPCFLIPVRVCLRDPPIYGRTTVLFLPTFRSDSIPLSCLDLKTCTRLLLSDRKNSDCFGLFRWFDWLCSRPLTWWSLRCLAVSMHSLFEVRIVRWLVVRLVLTWVCSVLGPVLGLVVSVVTIPTLMPLFSRTLALCLVTPAVTAMVLGPFVLVMTRVLRLRRWVPRMPRGTFLVLSTCDSTLDPLTEAALISRGRLWLRVLWTVLTIVVHPLVVA